MRLDKVATPMRPAAFTTEWVSSGAGRDGSTEAAGSDIVLDCNETEKGRPLSGENDALGILNDIVRQLIRVVALA